MAWEAMSPTFTLLLMTIRKRGKPGAVLVDRDEGRVDDLDV